MNRRQFLAAALASPWVPRATPARVAVARCAAYSASVYDALNTMFDQLGGLRGLVENKTVTIKVNFTGPPELQLAGTPVGSAQWVHWGVIGCTLELLGEAGARRILLCESAGDTSAPLEAYVARAGWDPAYFLSAAPDVRMVNTNLAGDYGRNARFAVPGGGTLFPGYDLSPAYEECDVFISLGKLKQHLMAGLTLSLKNLFGMLPLTIYGTHAGVAEPGESTSGFRGEVMHVGRRAPSLSAPQELDPESPRVAGYRLPRAIAELNAARPVDLAIIDGIETLAGGEGPWTSGLRLLQPHVLIAGLNAVSTDAVATAIMGFDPLSPAGEGPFRNTDNMLELAEAAGIGTRDLNQIEVTGERIEDVVCPFGALGPPTAM